MDAQQFNREMDARLSTSGVVDKDLFFQLADAHGYDTASTVGWVEAKLRVLQVRLQTGANLDLYVPSLGHVVSVATEDSFSAWAGQHFPNASLQDHRAPPNNSFKPNR